MKITITQDFDTIEEAENFLAAVSGRPSSVPPEMTIQIPPKMPAKSWLGADTMVPAPTPLTEPAKKPRKPRSDAGQPRGPYKTQNANAEAGSVPSGTPPTASSGGPAGNAPAPTAPASAAASTVSASDSVAIIEGIGLEPTIDDARAALKRINDTKGLGTPVCIGHLQSFGVNRVSDLPKDKYADFIKGADDMIARHEAAKK